VTSPASGAEGPAQVTGDAGVQPQGGSTAKGQGEAKQGANGQAGHPAWAEYLKDIPAGLHSAVTPAFSKWDQDMTAKLNSVQQQYAPWQSLIDGGADPERVSGAVELLGMLEENPAEAVALLAQHFGLGQDGQQEGDGGQGDGELGPSELDGDEVPDWARELQQGYQQNSELLDLVAQKIVADGQAAEMESAVDDLEGQLLPLMEQAKVDRNDEDAMDFIFAQLTNGKSPQEAVGRWSQFRTSLAGQQASAAAPQVLPAGGGLPTQQVDPTTLSTKDRRALAVQRARQLMQEGSGG
jgi:hypothetical protein